MDASKSSSRWTNGRTAWLGVLILGALLLGCPPHRTGDAPPTASSEPGAQLSAPPRRLVSCDKLAPARGNLSLEERSDRFRCVLLSMTPDQVRAVLGPADKVEQHRDYDGAERVTWRYKGAGPEGAVPVGYIEFGESDGVTAIQAPVYVPAPTVHRDQKTVVSPEGMVCELSGVSWSDRVIAAQVVLRNTGRNEYRFRHDHTAIKFNLLVTVHDDKGGVVGQQRMILLHSPYGEEVELVIPPGGQSSESMTLLPMRDGQILYLAPGRYSLQVAFPFHNNEYFASDRVPFIVQKP